MHIEHNSQNSSNWLACAPNATCDFDVKQCCKGTCETFICPIGFVLKHTSSTTLSNDNCCQAACGNFTCPTGYAQQNPDSTILTTDNCCQATCASFTCPSGFVHIAHSSQNSSNWLAC